MRLIRLPEIHRKSFGRFGSNYQRLIDRDFLLGQDPLDDHWMTRKKHPAANVIEKDDVYELELALPGYGIEDITLSVDNNVLTVEGTKKSDTEPVSKYLLKEHDLDHFERSFELSPIVDEDNISASFTNGMLIITLPTVEGAAYTGNPREIQIQ